MPIYGIMIMMAAFGHGHRLEGSEGDETLAHIAV